MLNEKYIFWETHYEVKIGKGVSLRSGYCEWCDPDSQMNQHIAIVSDEMLTYEQVRQIGHEIGDIRPNLSSDRHYLSMQYAHTSSVDIFQALYKLGQCLAKIFIETSFKGEKFVPEKYYLEQNIYREPHVWRRSKDNRVELLTREQYKTSFLKNKHLISWQPLSLSAVISDDFEKLPSDLFLPDRNECV